MSELAIFPDMALPGLILLAWLSPAAAADLPGRKVFDAAGCRACHSIGGNGGNAGPDLTFVGYRQSRDWLDLWLQSPKSWKHDTKMPEMRLQPGDRAAVIDFLVSLKGRDFIVPPWDAPGVAPAGRGKLIYDRVGCVACHGPAGAGGQPENNYHGYQIPALKRVADGYTFDELKKRIRGGRIPEPQDMSQPMPMVSMPAWGGILKEADIEDVAKYLMSLAPPKKADDF